MIEEWMTEKPGIVKESSSSDKPSINTTIGIEEHKILNELGSSGKSNPDKILRKLSAVILPLALIGSPAEIYEQPLSSFEGTLLSWQDDFRKNSSDLPPNATAKEINRYLSEIELAQRERVIVSIDSPEGSKVALTAIGVTNGVDHYLTFRELEALAVSNTHKETTVRVGHTHPQQAFTQLGFMPEDEYNAIRQNRKESRLVPPSINDINAALLMETRGNIDARDAVVDKNGMWEFDPQETHPFIERYRKASIKAIEMVGEVETKLTKEEFSVFDQARVKLRGGQDFDILSRVELVSLGKAQHVRFEQRERTLRLLDSEDLKGLVDVSLAQEKAMMAVTPQERTAAIGNYIKEAGDVGVKVKFTQRKDK